MANLKPKPEWFYDPRTYWKEYGIVNFAGKYAVVKSKAFDDEDYDVITDWVDRATAIGFLKLLKEKR